MPHLTLEYPANLRSNFKFDELFSRLHNVLAEVGGIAKGNCKSRAIERDRFFVGEGDNAGFVHLDVRFLEGRTPELKQEIGLSILAILREYYATESEVGAPQVTVEIHDIERAAYFKFPEGTLDVR
jgi:5-carboxymethyl-2-hydroxymuconate isomerase